MHAHRESANGREIVVLLRSLFSRWRNVMKASVDGMAWALALVIADLVRYEFHMPWIAFRGLAILLPLVLLTQAVAGLAWGLYAGRWVFGSFEEVAALVGAVILATGGALAIDTWLGEPRLVPLSAVVGGGFIALVWMCGARYAWRLAWEKRHGPVEESSGRMLIFGAGDGGAQVVRAMLRDRRETYTPVAMLDDDPTKHNLRVHRIPVVGDRRHIAAAKERYEADTLLIAIPSADSSLVSHLSELADQANLDVKVLPPVSQLLDGGVRVGDIRDITLADLLGRREIKTDLEAIAGYLTGKRVIVSGAGGSIGSELCRQIRQHRPGRLVMLDWDESSLHALELSIHGRALLDSPDIVVADICDAREMHRVFGEFRPDVVFHAAARKHLPLLERYPGEALKTNVRGTWNLLEAAEATGVERFVNISTDKAADPCSVLGYTKRIAERLTAHVATRADGTYLSVRFGNVLASNGSVLKTFDAQVTAGGPITVTHPEVTRFFMTVEEAVQLVIQAGAIGGDTEALVLDMGAPVQIADVARRYAGRLEDPISIVYTGLRPGEKLHEVLLGAEEQDLRPVHPLISHVKVPPLEPTIALELDPLLEPAVLSARLRQCSGAHLRKVEEMPELNGGLGAAPGVVG